MSPISIHALREEGDMRIALCRASLMLFLSTLSARRATYIAKVCGSAPGIFLSTLSARRAT